MLAGSHLPNLLVGLDARDDATVYRLNDEQAAVLTVDFFAPLVDDPYSYGAIAAANSMSDVYAMGGEVLLALNVAAFPEDLDEAIVADILRGGADKVFEAGGIIAGGHTMIDKEPKYGLCVLGLIHPQRVFTRSGARPGDALYLSKKLGTGIVTTAAMMDMADPRHLEAAILSMAQLNRRHSQIIREVGAHALTDVTGFGLLGHAFELAEASGVAIRIETGRVPILEGALEYAAQGAISGGESRNRHAWQERISLQDDVSDELASVLFDPQTSGGLLVAASPEQGRELEQQLSLSHLSLWRIGEVVEGEGITLVR
ncbi:MAG: selenide, water dikinase [Dehalococcoidia bacterium SM23_28_2]|nr:MAG: selenide, water dikinase [Dehalococcoidia bacterium SM23_28_2]